VLSFTKRGGVGDSLYIYTSEEILSKNVEIWNEKILFCHFRLAQPDKYFKGCTSSGMIIILKVNAIQKLFLNTKNWG